MKREILFRGKSINTNKWVLGYFNGTVNNGKVACIGNPEENGTIGWHVIPETVGQYTGLKDKNGKEIFEGDIVTDGKFKWIIEWHDQQAMWWMSPVIDSKVVGDEYLIMTLNNKKLGNGYYSRKDLEIIGNIYDNPELL